jgi:hypothetical protein
LDYLMENIYILLNRILNLNLKIIDTLRDFLMFLA